MKPTRRDNPPAAVRFFSSWRTVCLALFCVASNALGQEAEHPLKPADRSSPRAALQTFLEAGDTLGAFLAREYIPSPSRAKFQVLLSHAKTTIESLDLSEVPPAAGLKTGRAAALALYETLNRIALPPWESIPDGGQWVQSVGTNATDWVIPNTEIALRLVQSGPHRGEFLFSPETVANAADFYGRVHDLPDIRPVPLKHLKETILRGAGGWMIPPRWIQALPGALRVPLAEQPGWKWLGLVLLLIVFALPLRVAQRISQCGSDRHPFRQALAQLVLPAFLLLAAPAFAYLTLAQLNFLRYRLPGSS